MTAGTRIGYALVGVGGLLFAVGVASGRYHSVRFKQHRTRLSRLAENSEEGIDSDRVTEAIREFYEDDRVEWATRLLMLEPIAVLLLALGLGVLFL